MLVALRPFGVVTVTSTVPADCPGELVEIDVAELTVNEAGTVPKSTAVTPLKPVPVTVTAVLPTLGPDVGLTAVTAGADPAATKLNLSAVLVAVVPLGVVTVMSTVPADSAGEVAEMDVGEFTV